MQLDDYGKYSGLSKSTISLLLGISIYYMGAGIEPDRRPPVNRGSFLMVFTYLMGADSMSLESMEDPIARRLIAGAVAVAELRAEAGD